MLMTLTIQVTFISSYLQGVHIHIHLQILKNIEDIKRSIIERDTAVKNAEDGAADMKKRADDLTKELDESEKEYQVRKR